MKISQLVAQYFAVLPIGCALDEDQVTRNLREAITSYCGYRRLTSVQPEPDPAGAPPDSDLTDSELALIKPLWHLKNDRENAAAFEVSRSQGADPFGRSVAECDAAIEVYLRELPSKSFCYEVLSI